MALLVQVQPGPPEQRKGAFDSQVYGAYHLSQTHKWRDGSIPWCRVHISLVFLADEATAFLRIKRRSDEGRARIIDYSSFYGGLLE